MPEFYPRVEVRLSRSTRSKLEKFRLKVQENKSKRVTTSDVISAIVEQFLERQGLEVEDPG